MKALGVCVIVLCAMAHVAQAQQVRLEIDRGPYYVGSPVALQLVAEGFGFEPEPRSEGNPSSGTLTFLGMTPSESTSVVIINGSVDRSSSVRFLFRYRYTPTQSGAISLGPFKVKQGGTIRSIGPYTLDVQDVPQSDRLLVKLDLGVEQTYVGAELRGVVEYRVERELSENLVRSMLVIPALDLRDAFRIEPESGDPNGNLVEIATASGPLQLRATFRKERVSNRDWVIVSIPYRMTALKPGRYQLPPTSITIDEGATFANDLFGGRRAVSLRKLRAIDRVRELVVNALPSEGRPASFAGAVGRGYTLEVSADRSVVQVGDPIQLRFVLRGSGALERASLPRLDAEGLLSPRDFAFSADPPVGEVREGAKTFTALVRAKREDIREIPELAYSFFDPVARRYETVRSRPIALSVRPAQVVGPGAVLRSESPPSDAQQPQPSEASQERAVDEFALGRGDLSIVREPRALVAVSGGSGGWLAVLLHLAAPVLVVLAWLDRRRRDVDPVVLERRRLCGELLERATTAARSSDRASLRELARSLRAVLAGWPEQRSPACDAFLAECDAVLFAPVVDEAQPVSRELVERGLELARTAAERAR